MAIQFVLSVRDAAMNGFMRPFCAPNVGSAIRSFSDEVLRKDSEMNRHSSDYELFELGTFDEDTGRFSQLSDPRSVARGKDFFKE